MKKILMIFLTVAMLTGCTAKKGASQKSSSARTDQVTITDNTDILSTKADMSGYKWIGSKQADFEETTISEVTKIFTEKGSGILFFGYTGCKWCQRAVPELNKVAREMNVKIYYVDASVQPDEDQYNTLVGYLSDILDTDDKGQKEFFVPLVVGVKNGKIVGHHTSLVDGFDPQSDEDQLSDAQKQKLDDIYAGIIEKTAD